MITLWNYLTVQIVGFQIDHASQQAFSLYAPLVSTFYKDRNSKYADVTNILNAKWNIPISELDVLMQRLHDGDGFEKHRIICNISIKKHPEASKVAKFSCEMLQNLRRKYMIPKTLNKNI